MSVWKSLRFKLMRLAAGVLLVAPFPMISGAEETEPPSPERGLELAERLCKSCHLIGDNGGASVPSGPPTFRGIANRPGQTGRQIMNVLIQPHVPMPNMQVSGPEINDIIIYLESLRTDKGAPPLVPTWSPKPKLPSPS